MNFIGRKPQQDLPVAGYNKFTTTLDEGTEYIRFNAPKNITITDFMLEYASDASAYEPFGSTYSITFPDPPGTVYGGTLKIYTDGTGTLISNYDYAESNADGNMVLKSTGSIRAWSSITAMTYAYFTFSSRNTYVVDDSDVCNMYAHGTSDHNVRAYQSSADSRLRLTDTNIPGWSTATTREEIASAVTAYFASLYAQGQKLQIAVKVNTPVTYNLTAEEVGQILALNGINNVWADAGHVTVTYKKKG